MRWLNVLLAASFAALAGCTSVSTEVVRFDHGRQYPPTERVEVLLQKPERPHVEIAMIEARGASEAALLNEAREKARALGADAIVRLETERHYREPVTFYDPWYDPFPWGRYRHPLRRPFSSWYHPWGPHYGPPPQVIPGGYHYVLKAMAVKYIA